MRAVDDDEAAGALTYLAVIQIRAMARRRQPYYEWMGDDYVVCIGWLADLVHNLAAPPARTTPWRFRRERRHCMRYTWAVAGETGRKWILDSLEEEGLVWEPPPETSFTGNHDHHA